MSFSGGTGTELDPYQVATPEDLEEVRNHSGVSEETRVYFKQTADIDLNVPPYNTAPGWVPINSEYITYNGDSKKISNLYISGATGHLGLFGTAEACIIKDLE